MLPTGKGGEAAKTQRLSSADPAQRYAFVPDLGNDCVISYAFDSDTGVLTPNGSTELPDFFDGKPAGPRHMCFHPNERFAFVLNELNNTVTTMEYDAKSGVLTLLEGSTVSALVEQSSPRPDRGGAAEIVRSRRNLLSRSA